MGEWLVEMGVDAEVVQKVFEEHLSTLITKHFHSKKADSIFDQPEGETQSGIEWLPELIAHSPWRSLIYSLTEDYPECLMLNFAVKLISDAGYQHEIRSVTTAAQQLEIFSRVLTTAVDVLLSGRTDTSAYRRALSEVVRISCHSEYTYLYSQCLLSLLAQQEHHTKGGVEGAVKHISQSLRLAVQGSLLPHVQLPPVVGQGQDTTAMALALHNSGSFASVYNPALIQAMYSMLSKKALNPADMTLLFNWYSQNDPPPIELIRDPIFLQLLIDALFGPRSVKLHEDHRYKYVYLLAYAVSVTEYAKKGPRKHYNRDEVEPTENVIDSVSQLCQGRGDTASEVIAKLASIYQALKVPVVAGGVLHWVKCTVMESNYFQLHPEPVPIHLALLDEIASQHPLLHSQTFQLLRNLFMESTRCRESAGEVLMERQKTFIDRLVHLLWEGYALPVTEFIAGLREEGSVDTSLVRYFVMETLDVIGPPFASEFVEVFLPLVEDEDIVDESVLEKQPSAREFIMHCKS